MPKEQVRGDSLSLPITAVLEQFLNQYRDVGGLDAELSSALLAVRLRLLKLTGDHERLHDLQSCPQVSRPVAITEIRHQLVQYGPVLGLDGESKGLCTHNLIVDSLLTV